MAFSIDQAPYLRCILHLGEVWNPSKTVVYNSLGYREKDGGNHAGLSADRSIWGQWWSLSERGALSVHVEDRVETAVFDLVRAVLISSFVSPLKIFRTMKGFGMRIRNTLNVFRKGR